MAILEKELINETKDWFHRRGAEFTEYQMIFTKVLILGVVRASAVNPNQPFCKSENPTC